MATANQVINQLTQQVALVFKQISSFFSFVFNKVHNFMNLKLQEQIAYGVIGVGLVLTALSIALFIL